MKPMMLLLTIALVSGCGLTPKQLQALDGAMCTKTAGFGVSNTTTIVAGASRSQGITVGADCSIATQGAGKP
jgi:hypothetical protein